MKTFYIFYARIFYFISGTLFTKDIAELSRRIINKVC